MDNKSYEMIMCIINEGFSEIVMEAAKAVGVRGGTVIHGRGTADKEAEAFFNISIRPDKDMVIMVVASEIKDDVMHAVYKVAGPESDGQGFIFSVPVDDVAGFKE